MRFLGDTAFRPGAGSGTDLKNFHGIVDISLASIPVANSKDSEDFIDTEKSFTGSVGLLMTMTGNHRAVAWLVTASSAFNVLLNALLIPIAGIEGAAVATALTAGLSNIVMCVLVWRRLGIDPTLLSFVLRKRMWTGDPR